MERSPPESPLTPRVSRSSASPQRAITRWTRLSDWWVFKLSRTKTQGASGSVATVRSMWAAKSVSVRVRPIEGATT